MSEICLIWKSEIILLRQFTMKPVSPVTYFWWDIYRIWDLRDLKLKIIFKKKVTSFLLWQKHHACNTLDPNLSVWSYMYFNRSYGCRPNLFNVHIFNLRLVGYKHVRKNTVAAVFRLLYLLPNKCSIQNKNTTECVLDTTLCKQTQIM